MLPDADSELALHTLYVGRSLFPRQCLAPSPQPHAKQQAYEGEDCERLADHLLNSVPHSGHLPFDARKS